MLFALRLALLVPIAQQTTAGPPPSEGARISGVIVDAHSGSPLRGVRVVLLIEAPSPPPAMRGPHVLMTDPSGRFTFERLTAGAFRIDAMKAGYVRPGDPSERPTFSLTTDQHVDDVTVSLRKSGAIAGRILDDTNDLGEFRLFGLAPGDYTLVAAPAAAVTCFDCFGFDQPCSYLHVLSGHHGSRGLPSASRWLQARRLAASN